MDLTEEMVRRVRRGSLEGPLYLGLRDSKGSEVKFSEFNLGRFFAGKFRPRTFKGWQQFSKFHRLNSRTPSTLKTIFSRVKHIFGVIYQSKVLIDCNFVRFSTGLPGEKGETGIAGQMGPPGLPGPIGAKGNQQESFNLNLVSCTINKIIFRRSRYTWQTRSYWRTRPARIPGPPWPTRRSRDSWTSGTTRYFRLCLMYNFLINSFNITF